MSKLNKLVTNYPVSLSKDEIENLSATLAPVVAACGGGGGTGGKIYTGIGFVSVNNTTNQIGLTNEANTKLNQPIPTKVSDLSDSANYQTVAGMDDYLTTANAYSTYQTKDAMSAYWTSAETTEVFAEEISTIVGLINGKQDKLTFAYDNDKISAINGSALAGQGGVTGDYYSASNPSGFINSTQAETQILEKHYLTEASGNSLYVPIPNGLSDGQYYAMTTSSWKVIQGAGDVSGISTVAHDDTLTGNGNNENLGVDTTKIQTKLTDTEIQNITDVTTLKTASSTWDNVSAKLNTTDFNTYTATTAPSIYQEKGNYLSSNALEGYATTALLDTISSKIENDIPTTVAQLTDSGNYYTKSETSGASELSTEFANYQPKGNYLPTSGGTVSGQLEVHGGSNFDSQFIKLTREGNSCGARIGLGSDTTNGTLALKTFNGQGQNTVQVNIKHNTNNNELIQVQKGGSDVGFLIPAVTATTTDGLTNDGILHIILES